MKIVVLAGGLSAERDVSLSTGTMVCNALRDAGQRAALVDLFYGISEPGDMEALFTCEGRLEPYAVKRQAPDLAKIRRQRPAGGVGGIGPNVIELCRAADIVFLAMHGEPGENGMIQAMFDMMEIKYTGAGYFASAVAMDKGVTKQLLLHRGITTPEGRLFRKGSNEGEALSFPLPCIVKPRSGGSSIGIAKAFTEDALRAAVEAAFRLEDEILIERFIEGREFTCGVVGGRALPPAEVIPKGDFYDYAHKYQSGLITEVCPAQISRELTEEIQRASLEVFRCLGLEVYARMDYIYDGERLYCLEANTLPGMTPTSHLPQEAKAAGMGYKELCMQIIELSMKKYQMDRPQGAGD